MKSQNFNSLLLDIRTYLVFFFLVRLIGITDAPLESSHNWRQCFTNMVSRNFSEIKLNLLYPTVDLGGSGTGIVGSEFPFYNFLIYIFNSSFGYEHWYGRLINLIVSTIGIFFFYKLIKVLINKPVAFYSSLLLTTSVWFAFSRKIMPDTFSVSLVFIGLYYGYCFLKEGKILFLISYFFFSTLGVLCKIPAASLISVVILIVFIQEFTFKRKFILLIISVISGSIVGLWYFYWAPHLLELYNFQLYIPKGIIEGIKEIVPHTGDLLKRFYFTAFRSYLAFICCIGGLLFLIKKKQFLLLKGLSVISLVFGVFIIKTGAVFPLHSYYIIPYVPVMAIVIGYFIHSIPNKLKYLILIAIVIEACANQQHDFKIKEDRLHLLTLEEKVNQYIKKEDLIITTGGRTYQNMYFAHRRGWVAYNRDINRKSFTDSLANQGAKYLVVIKSDLLYQNKGYKKVYEDENYSFFDLH